MKKIVALILVLFLLITSTGTFVGCLGENENAEQSTIEITSPSTDDTTPEETPDDPGEDDFPDVEEHVYEAVVTKSTCTGEGYTTYTCINCGDSYVSDVVEPRGHDYGVLVTPPTCTTIGCTTYTCSYCGIISVEDIVDALGHSYKEVVTTPTCENHGYTTYVCEICNDSYVGDDVDALGHGYTSVVKAPTCTSEGYTTYTCPSCNESYVANKVAPLGHSYKTTIVAPSCESEGYTTHTCSSCGDSYVSNIVSALGHNYKTATTAPTCNSEGYTTYTCSTCSYSYVSDKVSASEHKYNTTKTTPTCENMGYSTHVCITCGYTYISDYLDALGHSWKDATTSAPKTCTTCGATEGDRLGSSSTPATYETLYVNYINVGQGDSMLLKVGDCDILIDAGTASYGSTVSSYLKKQGVDDIELMINTHPDADHCGGLTQVLKDYVVEEVWMSKNTSKNTAAYNNFVSAVSSEGLTAKKPNKGTVFTYEYLTLTVIYSESVSGDTNNSSIVVMVEYGNFRFLFTGDVGEEVEPKLISSGYDLKCDVLKVGHHGSKYSSTTAFLNAVDAEYGVICVGAGNSYGHPTSATLTRLANAGTSVYRTDKNGTVVFSTNGAVLTLPDGTTDTTGSGSGMTSGGSSSSGSSSSGSSSSGSSSSSSSSSDIFIGNTETKVFHLPTCSNLPSSSKQNVMYNYWWIINIAGYTPCGRCLKNYSGSTVTYIANATSKVYHVSTCSYLPTSSNRVYITSTVGYTPCGHCIK